MPNFPPLPTKVDFPFGRIVDFPFGRQVDFPPGTVAEVPDYIYIDTESAPFPLYCGVDDTKNLVTTVSDNMTSVPTSQRKFVKTSSKLYVVYNTLLAGKDQIYVIESADSGVTWTNATRISTYDGMNVQYQKYPSMAVDSAGNLHVVWNGKATGFTTKDQIWYAKFDGSSWSSPVQISTAAGMSTREQIRPCIAIDSADNLHVVWAGTATGFTTYKQIWYTKFDGSWSTPVRISTYANMATAGGQTTPSITPDSVDNLHVVWSGFATGFTAPQIWYAKYDGSWSSPVRISTYAGMDTEGTGQGHNSIAIDSGDVIHVVWSGPATGYESYEQIWYAKYDGSWSAPERISTDATMVNRYQYNPSVKAADSDVMMIWESVDTPVVLWMLTYGGALSMVQSPGRYPNFRWSMHHQ